MIQQSAHELDFGGIDLTGTVDYDGVTFHALAEGATLGNPVPVERSIESALLDGSFVVTDRYENREPSFQVQINATDSVALARGEKMLFEACGRRTTLGWKPADGFGARTVFEAHTSSLNWAFDDLDELRLVRAYTLRLVCQPFGQSETEVVDDLVEPPPVSPVTTVMSDGTSATGWTSPGGAVTVTSGALAIQVHVTRPTGPDQGFNYWYNQAAATYAFSAVDFTATPFVTADVWWDGPEGYLGGETLRLYADNVKLSIVANVTSPLGQGKRRITWRCVDPSVTSLRLEGDTKSYSALSTAPTIVLRLDNLTRSNVGPAQTSTGRQALRLADVTGSARTVASLEIGHPTESLGDVLVYTSPHLAMGYSPSLRPFMVPGPTVGPANATTISGTQTTSASAQVFDVPTSLMPEGPYLLVARVRSVSGSASRFIETEVTTKVGAGEFKPVELPRYEGFFDTTPWQMVPLGTLTMPTVRAAERSSAVVSVSVNAPNLYIDDVLAFFLGEDSELTWVQCGEGTPTIGAQFNWLFLDAPSVNNGGRPGIFVGTSQDRSDAFDPGFPAVRAWGQHVATTAGSGAFVITTGAQYPTISRRYPPTWFGNAAS